MAGFAAVKRGIMSHLWVIAPFLVIAFFTGLTAIFEWYVWIPAWAAGGYGMYKYLLPEVSSALKPAAARVKPVTKADEERVKQIASSFEAELLEEEAKEKAKQKAKDDKAKAAKLAALKEAKATTNIESSKKGKKGSKAGNDDEDDIDMHLMSNFVPGAKLPPSAARVAAVVSSSKGNQPKQSPPAAIPASSDDEDSSSKGGNSLIQRGKGKKVQGADGWTSTAY